GAGSILPRAGYGCAGHALLIDGQSAVTLFDCGPGTLRQLGPAGIALERVERVVLSHYHPDHCLDVLALAFARRNPALRRAPPIETIGPRGLLGLLERAAALYGARGWTRFEDARLTEVDPQAPHPRLERGELRLSWVANGHTPEAVSWRADVGD